MLTIAVCDDEERVLPELQSKIQEVLETLCEKAEILLFTSCEAVLKELEQKEVQILFLDIDLPAMTGFELARELNRQQKKTMIVFVTNQDALVYESFSFRPFAFIRKAYFGQEIMPVMKRLLEEYHRVPETFCFRTGSDEVRVGINQMIYFEAQGNYVRLVTVREEYRIRETIGSLEQRLECAGFIRIHKGFLVNQLFIMAVRQNEVLLEDQTVLAIGRSNKEMVRKKIMSYLR